MKASVQTNQILNNVSSFEKFFKKNYHLACLVALRYLKDEQLAEDVVQETFLYLWQRRSELEVQRNLKHYLLNAVKNRSINHFNRAKQFEYLSDINTEVSTSDGSDSDFSEEELAIQIANSIEELPPQCKRIFLLAYTENLTYKEIAATLNLSKNTIKTQMGIAYKILREELKNYFLILFVLPFRRLLH